MDVLPDRAAETLTAWLHEYPGVEIACRDSASAYAEAVRTACPDATQVAGRFHIWKNLCEAVGKCALAHRSCLAEPAEALAAGDADHACTAPVGETPDEPVPAELEGLRAIRRGKRHAAGACPLRQGSWDLSDR